MIFIIECMVKIRECILLKGDNADVKQASVLDLFHDLGSP
jgi:hypothetical protein